MDAVSGGVTYPKGFLAAGVRAGIKEHGEDTALICSGAPASAAGVFTTNVVKAAPVLVSRGRVPRGTARAVVANSGNANACTGEQGMSDALEMARRTAHLLDVAEEDVLVASTGVIGRRLPMEKVGSGIEQAARSLSADGGASAARAILTTDTHPKEAAVEIAIQGSKVRLGGIAKGAGMICPNLATMLSFITTDAAISPEMLQNCLSQSVEISFNCLTVDGDTSTNDTVIVLANGAAGNSMISSTGTDTDTFQKALDFVTSALAKQIAADGEGATKMVEISVKGTDSSGEARQIAKTIANSPLVKTAMFGCDPNWGRIVAAAGRAGVNFDPKEVNLFFGTVPLVQRGEPADFSEDDVRGLLSKPRVDVLLEVGSGSGAATVWTCDFSYDYVCVNAEYHT